MGWLCFGSQQDRKSAETPLPPPKAWSPTSPAQPSTDSAQEPRLPLAPLTPVNRSNGAISPPAPDQDPWETGPTQFVSKKYKRLKKIGTGGFGNVYLAEHRDTHEQVAIKFMDRGGDIRLIRREIVNHSNLCHPQVIQFKEVFLTPGSVGLVMEYAPGGDLFDYIQQHGNLHEDQARWIFQQLTVGVDFCHKKSIVNRDLKPENTLVVSRRNQKPLVKICDFGYSKNKEIQSMLVSKVGTPGYIAPEVLEGGRAHGPPADLWSLGCILYVLLYGRYPFLVDADLEDQSGSFSQTVKKIMSAHYEIPEDIYVSPEVIHLMRSLLIVNPEQRMTVEQMWSDPWFRKNLPKDARLLNDKMMKRRDAYQTPQQIDAILTQAQRRET
ncbi:hypothetical protein WJX74_007405 [Apatococcus lobatus]|uniref:Protein kinase domain-containing protein n=1 Tax=Apatococcus lobatus TaxID=904363 RepID=A0AAW1RSR3_9CHLO